MEKSEIEHFVKKLIKVIWENHEIDKIDQFYHHDLEGHYNDDPVSFEALVKKVAIFKEHMPGLKVEVLDLIVENDTFVLHAIQRVKRGGQELEIPTILIAHLKGSKIIKYWIKTEMPLEFNDY